MPRVIDQEAIVYDISTEQRLGRSFIESDGAWRMPRQVKYVEGTVARVEDVSFVEIAGKGCRYDPVLFEAIALIGQCHEQFASNPCACTGVVKVRVNIDVSFTRMTKAYVKLVRAADVIEVAMGAYRNDHAVPQDAHLRLEWPETHAAIDEQIPVSPTDEPDIASHP
jgi:hypothetical protein